MSSTCAFAVERANVDLIMFLMITIACAVFRGGGAGRIIAYLAIFVAALLKFYPITAMGLAMQEKKTRFIAVSVVTCIGGLAFVYFARHDLAEMWPNVPRPGPFMEGFGSLNFFEAFRDRLTQMFPEQASFLATAAAIAHGIAIAASFAISFLLYRWTRATGEATASIDKETVLFIAGTLIIVPAFFAGKNVAYRAIFLLTLLPLLVRLMRNAEAHTLARRLSSSAIATILILLWFECIRFSLDRLVGSYRAGDLLIILVREPLWWMLVTGLMTMLWTQISSTPFIGGLSLFRPRMHH